MIVGLSAGHSDDRQAERWLRQLLAPLDLPVGVLACTHLVRVPYPHVALSVDLPAGVDPAVLPAVPAELRAAAAQAAAEHAARSGGRAFLFPGAERLAGTPTVAQVLAASAIDRVAVLGAAPARPDTEVTTRDFVRPQWRDGTLTLVTTAVVGGRIAPFEVPDPTPCCAGH